MKEIHNQSADPAPCKASSVPITEKNKNKIASSVPKFKNEQGKFVKKCPNCDILIVGENSDNFLRHLKTHILSGAKESFFCKECGRGYSTRSNLIKHQKECT